MLNALINLISKQSFEETVSAKDTVVVHFWAPWCEPCAQLDGILALLAKEYSATFARVEAEEVTEVSLKFDITVVPLFLFFQKGKCVDRLEGADIAALRSKVEEHCPAAQPEPAYQGPASTTELKSESRAVQQPQVTDAALARVSQLVNSHPIMLLMKGSPSAPRCGFSSRVVAILDRLEIAFSTFDILSDQSVRQAAKVYSDWPSFPQLYVNGDLIGGCDIAEELDASGELRDILTPSLSKSSGPDFIKDRLKCLTKSADVMLFMKGSPAIPQCGFSAKVVQALKSVDVPFSTFDILQDQEVREGLKKFSDWPTFPQLYVGGELMGGCDIVLELLQQQQLRSEIESQLLASRKRQQSPAC